MNSFSATKHCTNNVNVCIQESSGTSNKLLEYFLGNATWAECNFKLVRDVCLCRGTMGRLIICYPHCQSCQYLGSQSERSLVWFRELLVTVTMSDVARF
jgi:hypothetical protein